MALLAELVNPRGHPSFPFPAPHADDQGTKKQRNEGRKERKKKKERRNRKKE